MLQATGESNGRKSCLQTANGLGNGQEGAPRNLEHRTQNTSHSHPPSLFGNKSEVVLWYKVKSHQKMRLQQTEVFQRTKQPRSMQQSIIIQCPAYLHVIPSKSWACLPYLAIWRSTNNHEEKTLWTNWIEFTGIT